LAFIFKRIFGLGELIDQEALNGVQLHAMTSTALVNGNITKQKLIKVVEVYESMTGMKIMMEQVNALIRKCAKAGISDMELAAFAPFLSVQQKRYNS
jgi:hypothetical protein